MKTFGKQSVMEWIACLKWAGLLESMLKKNIDGFRILKGASRHQNIDLLDTVCILWSVDYA